MKSMRVVRPLSNYRFILRCVSQPYSRGYYAEDSRFFSRYMTSGMQYPCLSFPLITFDPILLGSAPALTNKTSLNEIFLRKKPNSYWIPSLWPTPQLQVGTTCGLNALSIALNYANPNWFLPTKELLKFSSWDREAIEPPSTFKTTNPLLSAVLKAQGAGWNKTTEAGRIANIKYFEKLACRLNFSNGSAELLSIYTRKENYVETLCVRLKEGNSVIVTADLTEGYHEGMPGNSNARRLHYGLLFGYFSYHEQCYFLMTQWGKYYIWPADALFESNKQLPSSCYYSRFGLFRYKTPALEKSIDLERGVSPIYIMSPRPVP